MQKKKKRIYLTLGRRFVILASVTFLLPLAFFACFSSRNYSDGINLKLQQMTDSTLALVNKNIDYIIYDIESTSALITTNASVQSLLLDNGPQYSSDYRRKERSVWNTVINVTNNKDFLDIIFLANEHTAITKYRNSLAGEPIENYATLIASDWYKDLLSLRGKGAWYPGTEIPGFSSNLLVYAKAVLNMNNPETIGILLAGIGDSPFSRIFENLQVDFNAQILISQNGHTIYEYTPATEEFQASLSPMEKQTLLHTDGIVELTKKYYVRHVDNHSSGWRITCIVPYTPFLLERQNSSRTIFTIAAICFLIGVLLMCIFSNGMTRTLRKLKKYVEALRDGRSTDFISFSSNDEIGLVGNELVRVVAENQQLIQNLYQSLYKEKEAELMALQAQINPHFLYNTLDSIFWTAQEYHADEIGKMVVALSNVFKLSLNKGEKFITLGKELELVSNYLAIQQMRFGDSLHTKIDVPFELYNQKILKFLLQPLVENSLQHGLSEQGMNGTIHISATTDGTFLLISVEDDGVGLSCSPEEAIENGYALKNIRERIQLCYGTGCGLSFDTSFAKGCRITIRLTQLNIKEGA